MSQPDRLSRNVVIVGGVLALHVAALWALQSSLVHHASETIVPAELLTEFITPPAPKTAPPVPTPTALPSPQSLRPTPKVQAPRHANMPAATDLTPAPNAQTGIITPPPAALAKDVQVAPTAPPAPQTVPAPSRIEQPSSEAAYLDNPKPAYPAISKRMGEQGKVLLRVLIGSDGLPQKVEISQSSGYDRLDRQAQETVMRWRFVPGSRNGVPEAMWNLVPINFVLE